MTKLTLAACGIVLLTGLNGCSWETRADMSAPGRTVLVYMIASNLGNALDNNIEDMMYAAGAGGLNGGTLVVFYSKNSDEAELFEIRRGAGNLASRHHIRHYDGMSAVAPATMRQVVRDVTERYPSDSYGMILSSHGTSWLPASYGNTPRSFGEENRRSMEIYELAAGLPDRLFDFLVFDACSMASVECLYELRNKAGYIMASPSEILSYGIPYKTVLPCLFQQNADLADAAGKFHVFYKTIFDTHYGNISVVKTDELENLAQITRDIIADAGQNTVYTPPLPNWQVLAYWNSSPTPLYDLEDVIIRLATDAQHTRFKTCLRKAVPVFYSTNEIYCSNGPSIVSVNRFSGLSVYPLQSQLPQLNDWYKQLEWYKAVY
ncbi:MAG: hypothetical protein LBJ23_04465 [Tannerella sp.]|jgi:hypothetical protein|nr:hypothetical protein [Tannerella sp.]